MFAEPPGKRILFRKKPRSASEPFTSIFRASQSRENHDGTTDKALTRPTATVRFTCCL